MPHNATVVVLVMAAVLAQAAWGALPVVRVAGEDGRVVGEPVFVKRNVVVSLDSGVALRSTDGGAWERVVVPADTGSMGIEAVVGSGGVVVAIGQAPHTQHWRSDDGGQTWSGFLTPLPIDVGGSVGAARGPDALISFHPVHPTWMLAVLASEGCSVTPKFRCFRISAMSRDAGVSWVLLANYVVDHAWVAELASDAPFAADAVRVVKWGADVAEGNQIDLDYSDSMVYLVLDAGVAVPVADPLAMAIVPVLFVRPRTVAWVVDPPSFVYLVGAERGRAGELSFSLHVATDELTFAAATHPPIDGREGSIVFVEEDAVAVFVFVAHSSSDFGTLLVSSADGAYFDVALRFVALSDGAPAVRATSLDGVFLANVVTTPYAPDKADRAAVTTWISFDNGAEWAPLHPVDAGPALPPVCASTPRCVPVLDLATLATSPFRPGVFVAAAELGPAGPATVESTDGGATWRIRSAESKHRVVFSPHGEVALVVPDTPATMLQYAAGDGLATVVALSNRAEEFEVGRAYAFGSLDSFSFLLTAHSADDGNVLIHIVFAGAAVPPPCSAHAYDRWTPVGRCVLGRNVTYERALGPCSPTTTAVDVGAACPCTPSDWECDVGYEADGPSGERCVAVASPPPPSLGILVPQEALGCPESGYNRRSRGYRRAAGDTCVAAADDPRAPLMVACRLPEPAPASRFPIYAALVASVFIVVGGGIAVWFQLKRHRLVGVPFGRPNPAHYARVAPVDAASGDDSGSVDLTGTPLAGASRDSSSEDGLVPSLAAGGGSSRSADSGGSR